MIPHDLIRALNLEIHEGDRSQPRHLSALIDMALVPEDQRQAIAAHFAANVHPLLRDPELAALQPLGAMLVSAAGSGPGQYDAVLSRVGTRCESFVQAWIASVLPAEQLALHLSEATYALGASQERYLLRYYDPLVTPVLYVHADRAWVSWFFGPVLSWWFADATQQTSRWRRIRGGGRGVGAIAPQALHLNDALWQALESDPLPHRLLRTLEAQAPHVFESHCGGIRLAQVEAQLNDARQVGLTRHEDLTTYVLVGMTHSWSQKTADARWQAALDRAVAGGEPLHESLARLSIPQDRGARS